MAFSPRLIRQRSALPTITISWSDERPIDRGIPDHHIENLKLVPARQNDQESDPKHGTTVDRDLKENQIRAAAEFRQAADHGGRPSRRFVLGQARFLRLESARPDGPHGSVEQGQELYGWQE
jgi:hypothetical protein